MRNRNRPLPMTRGHFEFIAKMVRDLPGIFDAPATPFVGAASFRDTIAQHFGMDLRDSNPQFDRQRFLDACKPDAPNKEES